MESCDEPVDTTFSLSFALACSLVPKVSRTFSFLLPHRLVQPLLIGLLLTATLAAPAGREKQVLEALPEALEKPFYRQNTFTVIC